MVDMPLKAFDFKGLIASEDVFSFMGITAGLPHRFVDIPTENKAPCTPEQKKELQAEIEATLRRRSLDTHILAWQMFA